MATMVADPQTDVDALVEDVKAAARGRSALARKFRDYAEGARGTAVRDHVKGDSYCETLATIRADVYEMAAGVVEQLPLTEAAFEMMRRAKTTHQRTAPLINFDSAGEGYIRARAWQFCAWTINPTLPEVQRKWS